MDPMPSTHPLFRDHDETNKSLVHYGFAALSRLDERTLAEVAKHACDLLDPLHPMLDGAASAQSMGIPKDDLEPLMLAVSMLSTAMYSPGTSEIAGFLDGAVEGGFLDDENRRAIESFFENHLVAHGPKLRQALLREKASLFVIPSFRAMDATTDVRVAHDGTDIVTVPMALLLIQTDVRDSLVFQATPRDIDKMRLILEATLAKLNDLAKTRLVKD